MRFKSRFTIIGVLAAAALMLLTVVPAMADVAITLTTPEAGFITNEPFGATKNEVGVSVIDTDLAAGGDPDTGPMTVENLKTDEKITVTLIETVADDGTLLGLFTVINDADKTSELEGAIVDGTTTTVNVTASDGSLFVGGDVLLIGREGEQVLVISVSVDALTVGRGVNGTTPVAHVDDTLIFILADSTDSTRDIDEGGDYLAGDTTLTVTSEAGFVVRDVILIEAEQLVITGVASLTLTVVRGANGTTAADHVNGSDIFDITPSNKIFADDAERLQVKFGVRATELTVDAKDPEVDDEFPSDEAFTSARTVFVGATIQDLAGSGLGDDAAVKTRTTLKFTTRPGGVPEVIGEPDINDVTELADDVWTVSYGLSLGDFEGAYTAELTVIDLAGNPEVFTWDFTVDRDEPRIRQATTGLAYDSDKKNTKEDRNSIAVVFENFDSKADELLLSGSLDPSDFVVENNEVTGVVFPNLASDPSDPNGVDLSGVPGAAHAFHGGTQDDETRHVVFLTLRDELTSDEEPLVQILAGSLEDLAGNSNSAQSLDADDGIAPKFTITITGETSSGRAVVQDKGKHSFTVRVSADETLKNNNPPTVYMVTLDDVSDETDDLGDVEVDQVKTPLAGELDLVGTNTWEATLDGDDPGFTGGPFSGLVVVFVVGEDENGVTGTSKGVSAGVDNTPQADEDVGLSDAAKAGALIEWDSELKMASTKFELRPAKSGTTDETESPNPFIVINFDEKAEYSIKIDSDGDNDIDVNDVSSDKIDDTEIDTHDTVTLTSLTLDGVDVLGQIGTIDDDSFVVALSGLAVGEYELLCTAVDEVGNEIDDGTCDFDFEVVERGDYEVPLNPGWNLVSLPGTPADPAIDSVLPSSMSASRILQWTGGAFEVAERGDDGTWDPSGQITEITAGPGYWVFTTAFEDIETLIPERAPQTVLPTVDIVGGWNLVGIVDLAQADAGDAPGDTEGIGIGGGGEDFDVLPSAYFVSLEWSVAYSYDTTSGLWTKYTGVGGDGSVVNGKGYWIWATEAGTLVP